MLETPHHARHVLNHSIRVLLSLPQGWGKRKQWEAGKQRPGEKATCLGTSMTLLTQP